MFADADQHMWGKKLFQQFQFITIIFNMFQSKQSYYKLVMTAHYIYMHFNYFYNFELGDYNLCQHISLYFNFGEY